jgi:hypothetical protein
MSEITRNPLCWPDGVARTPPHQRGNPRFNERSLYVAAEFVLNEINRLNSRWHGHRDDSVIVSSNLRLKNDGTPYSGQTEPNDTGVAVYFKLNFRRGNNTVDRPIVMTCDRWKKTADNLYAIGKDIEAQRARDRWGCTNFEQAFRGYLAIPERCGHGPWWEILGIPSTATEKHIKAAMREKAKSCHPDKGGSHDAWVAIQEAYEQGLASVKQ